MGLAVLLLAAAAPAMVLRVPGEAPDLATALGFAQSGDTLLLRPGRHRAVDLHLADGITVLGEGPGVVLKGNHHRSLLNIRGAHQGVVLENLELTSGRSRRDGGALRITDSRVRLTGLAIRGCRARHAGGALFALDSHLELRDCLFLDNRADDGGAIALAERDTTAKGGGLLAHNVLFAGNQARHGGAISSAVPLRAINGTFADNRVTGPGAAGAAIAAGDSLVLDLCNLTGNRGGPAGESPVALVSAPEPDVRYTNLFRNGSGDWVGPLAEFEAKRGNRIRDPRFVDASRGDYRLHWQSPLQDVAGTRAPLDFDQTPGDLGWRPVYTSVELRELPADGILPRGHYTVTKDLILAADSLRIEDGAVIRVEGRHALSLLPANGPLRIGHLQGARTALVSPVEDRARWIRLGPLAGTSRARIEGVLFNNAPLEGYHFSRLEGVHLINDLGGPPPPQAEPATVRFQGQYGSPLRLSACTEARVAVLQFKRGIGHDPTRFGHLAVIQGEVELADNQFDASPMVMHEEPLVMVGCTGAAVLGNTFIGARAIRSALCRQTGGVAHYRNNRFVDLADTGLELQYGSARMDRQAGNEFLTKATGISKPLIRMQAGALALECGGNLFKNENASWQVNPFISASSYTHGPASWHGNFWGFHEDMPIPGDVMNGDPAAGIEGFVPRWADASNSLTETGTPPDACRQQDTTEGPIAAALTQPAGMADSAVIQDLSERIRDLPAHTESPEATELLKSLGLNTPDTRRAAQAALLKAAGRSGAMQDEWLSATQFTYAQCVEAGSGNLAGAIATLDSCVSHGTDIVKDMATLARLEIATYPMSAGDAESGDGTAVQHEIDRQSAALQALESWRPGDRAGE